jgi:hypothetical protein
MEYVIIGSITVLAVMCLALFSANLRLIGERDGARREGLRYECLHNTLQVNYTTLKHKYVGVQGDLALRTRERDEVIAAYIKLKSPLKDALPVFKLFENASKRGH